MIHRSVKNAAIVAVDPLESRVYWNEFSNQASIYSSKLDGSDVLSVVTNGLLTAEDVAVDYVAKNLYLTDSYLKQILVCKMDGSMCLAIHKTRVDKPRGIALDPSKGLLYWTDWGNHTAGIYRSGMDGSNRVTLVSENIVWPNRVAIDHATNRLYWCDANTQTIEFITLDSHVRKVVIKDEQSHPYSLAVFEDLVYWSDWRSLTVKSTNKFTGHIIHVMIKSQDRQIMGVNIYHPVLAIRVDDTYPMLFTHDRTRVYRIWYEAAGNRAVEVLPFYFESIGRLAFDWESKVLFISDTVSSAIYSVNMTTFRRRELLKNITSSEGLAFDFESGNLYWVDSSNGTVVVISPKTLKSATVVRHLYKPYDVVLMSNSGRMFVSFISDSPMIMMFDMDGKNGKVLNANVGSLLATPAHPSVRLLYWADLKNGTISWIDFSNPVSEPRVLVEKVGELTSLAVNEKYLFWTDSKSHALHLRSFNHSYSLVISMPREKSDMIRGVIYASATADRRSAEESDCAKNNGGCSYLCLTSPTGRSCACPYGMMLSQDGKSCIACEAYACPVSGEYISWTKVCDGNHDCDDLDDEGSLCDISCSSGSCSHKCQKTPQGPKCSCYEGYVLSRDGVSCEDDVNKCNTPGRCSHFCNNTKDGFKCSCAEGYNLETDQRTCKAIGGEAHLAYLSVDSIRGIGLETHSSQVYISRNFVPVSGMGYDAYERIFFFAEQKKKTIKSYFIDSAQLAILLKTQQEPLLPRRDWMTKNIFYTTDEGSIVCCNGNGSYCTSVIINVSSHISGFDISPTFGFIFWSISRHHNHNSVSGVIERANMDGSFRQVIVSENIFLPTAVTVDPVLETIYWCDSVLGVLESTDFNGFRRRKIVDQLHYPISMTVFEDYIYWSDRATNSLSRCDKFSGKDRVTLLTADTQINFLTIIHKAAQMQGENRCADSNCSHICFLTRTSFVCKCDDRKLIETSNCELGSESSNHSCPEDYCSQNADCVIYGDHYVCRCPLLSQERDVKKSAQHIQHSRNSSNEPHPVCEDSVTRAITGTIRKGEGENEFHHPPV
ncbi:Low-density lipoprotein receptor-related protein 4 [Araneus ventricosus]|uniref:Low-density lipoprotein receptor-related protein 4 n=1 Tax=Araneus ventricosus TaxID=182803 RepID=A0A4Y2E816_ARAVE|nr:Low-density lipoprotein receptor-related protein 4 [Araneus ventricosus]